MHSKRHRDLAKTVCADKIPCFALEPGKWALLMSGVSPTVGRGISQRLVEAVWASHLPNHGSPLARASISIGLAPPTNDADSTESDADEALEQSIMGVVTKSGSSESGWFNLYAHSVPARSERPTPMALA